MKTYLILLYFICLPGTLIQAQNKKAVRFISDYKEAAFWSVDGRTQPLIKWKNEIDTLKYFVKGEYEYMDSKVWKKFISQLEQLIGKKIIQTTEKDYHILIYFGPLWEYGRYIGQQLPPNIVNRFNNWHSHRCDDNYHLTKASYCLVPSKITTSEEGIFCLKKYFLLSLGLLGKANNEYSIFYQYLSPGNTSMSREDKRIVKLHYNGSISAGVSLKELTSSLMEFQDIEDLASEKL